MAKKKAVRRKKVAAATVGLTAAETANVKGGERRSFRLRARRIAITVVIAETAARDQLRDCEATCAAHRFLAPIDSCAQRAVDQRLAAVEAFLSRAPRDL